MANFGFRNKQDALALRRLARREKIIPVRGTRQDHPKIITPGLRHYIVRPKEIIPGAENIGGNITPGQGEVWVMERSKINGRIIFHKDSSGRKVTRTVYNLCPDRIIPITDSSASGGGIWPFTHAIQDTFGDLWILESCPGGSSSSSIYVPPCEFCNDGTTALQLQVELEGIVDDTCTSCDLLDGTYILDQDYANVGNYCIWGYSLTDNSEEIDYCPPDFEMTLITCSVFENIITGDTVVRVVLTDGNTPLLLAWSKEISESTIDCLFDGLELDTTFVNNNECDLSSSTCTVTAL